MDDMNFEIRKGVDLPAPPTSLNPYPSKYPLNTMDVGDMFFIPGAKMRSISSLISARGKRLGKHFCCRTLVEDGVLGVGVWRDQ